MKNLIKAAIVTLSLVSSVYAVDLQDIMKQMGSDFKAITRAALTSNNSPESKATALRLKESIELAGDHLPPSVDPSNADLVKRYQSVMAELLVEATKLNEVFETEPLNKAQALDALKKMGNIRKKGHGIFR